MMGISIRADRKEEEVYVFRSDPRDNGVKLLLSVEEASYNGELPASRRTAFKTHKADDGKSTGVFAGHGSPHPIGMSSPNGRTNA
jgi:hypothetical protein